MYKKWIGVATAVAGLVCSATVASAQAPGSSSSRPGFVSVNASGQMQERNFTSASTFTTFAETGGLASSQTIGRGGVLDITGGYRVGKHLGVALGIWGASTKVAAATSAAIPDPLYFGRFKTVTLTTDDTGTTLKQTTLGANLLLTWTTPVTDRIDLSVFLGPTFMHLKQDVASVAVTSNGQSITMATASESASTARAGTIGCDLSQRMTDRFGVGVFVRYSGGEADLPSVAKLKVGGLQVGGGIRAQF